MGKRGVDKVWDKVMKDVICKCGSPMLINPVSFDFSGNTKVTVEYRCISCGNEKTLINEE